MDSLNLELCPKPYDDNCEFGFDINYENNNRASACVPECIPARLSAGPKRSDQKGDESGHSPYPEGCILGKNKIYILSVLSGYK